MDNIKNLYNLFDELKGSKQNEETSTIDNDKCNNCGSYNITSDIENISCMECGYIIDNVISFGKDWKNFEGKDEDHDRCGIAVNPLLPKSSFGTMILGGGGNQFLRRIDRWNNVVYKEKSLLQVFAIIKKNSQDGGILQRIIDKSIHLYKILSEDITKRGISRTSVMAACVYNACSDYSTNNPEFFKSSKEISELFGLSRNRMTDGCKHFDEIIYQKNKDYIKPKNTRYYIKCFSEKLLLPKKYINSIQNISKNIDMLGIILENTPRSLAVGCIYLFIVEKNIEISKKKISEECEISEVTILKIHKKIDIWKRYLI